MRIGLIGDVHGEDKALVRVLRVLRDAGAERMMCVGDIVDGPGDVDRCCELLEASGAAVVRGNHDRWLNMRLAMREALPDVTRTLGAAARRFIAALPAELRFPVAGGEVVLCHGLGGDDMASVAQDAGQLAKLRAEDRQLWILNGHTHERGVWRRGKVTIINAGTLFRDHNPCCGLVDLVRGEVTYFDVQGARLSRETVPRLRPPSG